MTCLGAKLPLNFDAWLSLVNDCATAAGGPGWPSLALTGLAAVALAGFAVLGVAAWVGRGRW